jgi:hypothetical protein
MRRGWYKSVCTTLALLSSVARADELPRLLGTVAGPEATFAVFQLPGTGDAVQVREGDHIGSLQIVRITHDAVTVRDGGGMQVLRPGFAASPAGPPPPGELEAHTQGGDHHPE